jgi:hypothetical protein
MDTCHRHAGMTKGGEIPRSQLAGMMRMQNGWEDKKMNWGRMTKRGKWLDVYQTRK